MATEARLPNTIVVRLIVGASLEKAWNCWNEPDHIRGWAVDSSDWSVSDAENDLLVGGKFTVSTQKKNSDESVDFVGTYSLIVDRKRIEYDLEDGRHVVVSFTETTDGVEIVEEIEAEPGGRLEEQRESWQMTLENFKKYVERER